MSSAIGGMLSRFGICCGLAVPFGGCSISLPIAGFEDPVATGSIVRPDAILFKSLDQEDGRRARAALAVALDPQGNGASVAWGNPQSGAKGSFVATAVPFTEGSRVCRAFRARVEPDARSDRSVEGRACRDTEGDWRVSDARESIEAKAAGDAKAAGNGKDAKGAADGKATGDGRGQKDARATSEPGRRPG